MSIYAQLAATNLCQNPGFDASRAVVDYWSPFAANGTYSYDTTEKWTGVASYKYTITTVAQYLGFYSPAIFADSRRIIVTPGLLYSGKFRIKAAPSVYDTSGRVGMHFKNDSNTTIAELWGDDFYISPEKWTEIKFEGVEAPAGSTFVEFRCFINHFATGFIGVPPAVGNYYNFDGADFRQADFVDSFIDGYQGPDYGWNGSPYQSTSYRKARIYNFNVGKGGLIKITPELYLADKLNNIGEDVTEFIKSGMVEMRSDRAIKMQFKGELTAPMEITPFTYYLAPYLTVEYLDDDTQNVREQVGLYSTAPMAERISRVSRTGVLNGLDLCWNLSEASFGGYYSIPAGANYVNEVIKILASEGFTKYSITPSPLVLPLNRTWKAEDSKLTIINDLLESIGYYSIYSSRYGIFTSFPYNDLAFVTPAAFYYSGQGSSIVGALQKEPLIDSIINYVKIIKEDTSNPANSFVYELKNMNLDSPVSIPNLGRQRFLAINDSTIVDLATAQAKAKRIIQDAASLYTKYTMQSLPDPERNVWEVYDVNIKMDNNDSVLTGRVRVSGWDIGFTPSSAIMTHYFNRLENI